MKRDLTDQCINTRTKPKNIMAFQYFNSEIEYQGQDLHILRNNQPFPLHNFFKIDNTITITINLDFVVQKMC